MPPEYVASDLLSDQFLFEGHQYISDAFKPPIVFTNGSRYAMGIVDGHKMIRVRPVNPSDLPPDFPKIILQCKESYHPPKNINWRQDGHEYFDMKLLGNANEFGNLAQDHGNTKMPAALIHHR